MVATPCRAMGCCEQCRFCAPATRLHHPMIYIMRYRIHPRIPDSPTAHLDARRWLQRNSPRIASTRPCQPKWRRVSPLPRGRGASMSAVDVVGTLAGSACACRRATERAVQYTAGKAPCKRRLCTPSSAFSRKLSKAWGNPRTEGKVNDPAGASARLCTILLSNTPHEPTARVSNGAIKPHPDE
jgi:hypothetical protein